MGRFLYCTTGVIQTGCYVTLLSRQHWTSNFSPYIHIFLTICPWITGTPSRFLATAEDRKKSQLDKIINQFQPPRHCKSDAIFIGTQKVMHPWFTLCYFDRYMLPLKKPSAFKSVQNLCGSSHDCSSL